MHKDIPCGGAVTRFVLHIMLVATMFTFARADDESAEPAALHTENTSNETTRLFQRLAAILEFVERVHPGVSSRLDETEEDTINAVLSRLGGGYRFLTDDDPAVSPSSTENSGETGEAGTTASDPFTGVMIANNRILYVRIDDWSAATYEKLLEDCRLAASLGRRPLGIVFDLRSGGGNDYSDMLKAAALFCNHEKIPADPAVETEQRMVHIPCAVLVGSRTKGTSEVFCRILRDAGRCLVIGQKTAGAPFPMQSHKMEFGTLLYPEIPASHPLIRIEPILPDIPVANSKQANYADVSGTEKGESNDASLTRACDLLIGLHSLKSTAGETVADKAKASPDSRSATPPTPSPASPAPRQTQKEPDES